MKLKNLIGAVLFVMIALSFTVSQAQTYETYFDNGASGDTTETFDIPSGRSICFITVVDSAETGTDTVMAFIKTGLSVGGYSVYSNVSVRDLASTALTTYVAIMVPGASTTKTYSIDLSQVPPGELTILRTNSGTDNNYTPVTRIKVLFE